MGIYSLLSFFFAHLTFALADIFARASIVTGGFLFADSDILARLSSEAGGLNFADADILARLSDETEWNFCAADMFARASSVAFLPFEVSDILARVSIDMGGFNLAEDDILARASDEAGGLNFITTESFLRVSSEARNPLREDPAKIAMLYSGFISSIHACSLHIKENTKHTSMIEKVKASSPSLFQALCKWRFTCVPSLKLFLCAPHLSLILQELPI